MTRFFDKALANFKNNRGGALLDASPLLRVRGAKLGIFEIHALPPLQQTLYFQKQYLFMDGSSEVAMSPHGQKPLPTQQHPIKPEILHISGHL
jgi:hypothetical protein